MKTMLRGTTPLRVQRARGVGGLRGRAAPFRLVESETWPRAAASREPTEARLFWRSSFTVARSETADRSRRDILITLVIYTTC